MINRGSTQKDSGRE
jgi:hypothetical protein